MEKICSKCKQSKDEEEFPYQNKDLNKRTSACRICKSLIQKKLRIDNLELIRKKDRENYNKNRDQYLRRTREYRKRYPDRTRRTHLKVKYGITPEIFEEKLLEQNHKCAICSRDMKEYGKIFCVDHNHTTGKIRGLVCDPCNYGLGFYEKHKDKYIEYLKKYM